MDDERQQLLTYVRRLQDRERDQRSKNGISEWGCLAAAFFLGTQVVRLLPEVEMSQALLHLSSEMLVTGLLIRHFFNLTEISVTFGRPKLHSRYRAGDDMAQVVPESILLAAITMSAPLTYPVCVLYAIVGYRILRLIYRSVLEYYAFPSPVRDGEGLRALLALFAVSGGIRAVQNAVRLSEQVTPSDFSFALSLAAMACVLCLAFALHVELIESALLANLEKALVYEELDVARAKRLVEHIIHEPDLATMIGERLTDLRTTLDAARSFVSESPARQRLPLFRFGEDEMFLRIKAMAQRLFTAQIEAVLLASYIRRLGTRLLARVPRIEETLDLVSELLDGLQAAQDEVCQKLCRASANPYCLFKITLRQRFLLRQYAGWKHSRTLGCRLAMSRINSASDREEDLTRPEAARPDSSHQAPAPAARTSSPGR